MKKISLYITLAIVSLVFGACSDGYEPWGNPQAYEEESPITIPGLKALEVPAQDLATVGTDVPVFTLSSKEAPEGFELKNARVELLPNDINLDGVTPTIIETSLDGKAATAAIQEAFIKYYGKRPVAHRFNAHVVVNAVKDGQAILIDAGNIMYTVTPNSPFIDEAYYLIGDMTGWNKEGAIKFIHSNKDVYEDPVFSVFVTTTAANQTWKITTETNYKGELLATGKTGVLGTTKEGDTSMEGKLTTEGAGAGKLAEAGKYRITINMMTYTYKVEKLNFTEYLWMAGNANGWTHNDINVLHGPAFDGKYTGYMYLDNKGFKFSEQKGWASSVPNGKDYGENFSTDGGAGNIMMTEADGFYKVEVDLGALSYKLTPIKTIGIIGNATVNGWNGDIAMTYDNATRAWTAQHVVLKAGSIKFRANAAWDISWGGTDLNKLTTQNGANINVTAGTYTVKLTPSYDGNTKVELIAE